MTEPSREEDEPRPGEARTRRAVVDIGTNSVRVLVADLVAENNRYDPGGVRLVPVWRDLESPRLGRGVDRAGRLAEESMRAAAAAVREFVAKARRLGAEAVEVVGTSALRDAANREEFVELVRREAGVDVRVISGREEAALTFLGAVRGTPMGHRPTARGDAQGRRGAYAQGGPALGMAAAEELESATVYVLDIGGGSTELARGRADGTMESAVSVDAGAVRLTELCVHSDPISSGDWQRLVAEVRARLEPLWSMRARGATLVAVGGTATTLAAMRLRLHVYDPMRVHGFVLARGDVARLVGALRRTTVAERRAWPGLQPRRADIILAGAVIAHEVMVGLGMDRMMVSESDLLEGVLLPGAGVATSGAR